MSKYEQHFGLSGPVFSDKEKPFVYVSDQLRAIDLAFETAFDEPSAVISVRGPVGIGKTVAVRHALASLEGSTRRIDIGRMRLQADEVLDLILAELGEDSQDGTLRKLASLRKTLNSLPDDRLVIVVEDAARTGLETLAELDVICGDDGGFDIGLVICGDEKLVKLLADERLERLAQRTSANLQISSLPVDEMEAFLSGAVTAVGSSADELFSKDYVALLHILSCGVPRVAKKLVTASLKQSAANGEQRASCSTLADVAKSQFGITTELPIQKPRPVGQEPQTGKPKDAQVATPPQEKLTPVATPKAERAAPSSPAETARAAASTASAAPRPGTASDEHSQRKPQASQHRAPVEDTPPKQTTAPQQTVSSSHNESRAESRSGTGHAEPAVKKDESLPGKAKPAANTDIAARSDAQVRSDSSGLPQKTVESSPSDSSHEASPAKTPKPEAAEARDELPYLIQDTQPDLVALSPDSSSADAGSRAAESDNVDHEMLPDLDELAAELEAASTDLSARLKIGDSGKAESPAGAPEAPRLATEKTTTPASSKSKLPTPDEIPTLESTDAHTASASRPAATSTAPIPEPVEQDEAEDTATSKVLGISPIPDPDAKTVEPPRESAPRAPIPDAPADDLAASADAAGRQAAPGPAHDDLAPQPGAGTKQPAARERTPEETLSDLNAALEAQQASISAITLSLDEDSPDSDAEKPVPEWDRDPTLAELKPDLDALELALAEDVVIEEVEDSAKDDANTVVEEKAPPNDFPTITLDTSIEEKVKAESEELARQRSESGASKSEGSAAEPARSGPSDTELHRMAERLSSATSLEDVDDRLAETLFGDEINLVASQMLKQARDKAESANDAPAAAAAKASPAAEAPAAAKAKPKGAAPPEDEDMRKEFEAVWGQVPDESESIDIRSGKPNSGMDMSASQRLATVRALNAGMGKPMPPPVARPKQAPRQKPVPIEDQIDISMTATMKKLKIDPKVLEQQQEPEEEKKGGFFSRFRKKG